MGKNILFVGVAYYPNVGYGGPIRAMRSYGLGLTSLGHKVTIYCSNLVNHQHKKRMADYTVEAKRDGMRIVYMNTDLCLSAGLTISLDLLRYLRREISSYDAVHLCGPRNFFVSMAGVYARKYRIPYFIHPMGSISYAKSKVALKFIWDILFGRRFIYGAKYIAESTDEQVKDLLAFGIPKSKIAVVPWSPDPALVCFQVQRGRFREKIGVSLDDKVILFLGRIHRKKRLDLVIRALGCLGQANVRLVVVGHDDDGSLEHLKTLVAELKLEKQVIWAGPIHSPESAMAYRDADVFVLISQLESAPMALLEACSMGVPVLISDHTGMSEMIHNRAGLVVEMTPEAVASGLSVLTQNEKLCRQYAIGGQELIAQNFSAEVVGSKLTSLYE